MHKFRDIFVLMRVFNGYLSQPSKQTEFYRRLQQALHSVKNNALSYQDMGNVYLIINDDTAQSDIAEFEAHRERLKCILREEDFLAGRNLFYTESPGGEGSSAATLRIRRKFIEIAQNRSLSLSNTIAVSLDQDDELCKKALVRIERSMKDNGIVLSKFFIKDDNNLDITDDAGKAHNKLSRFLCYPRFIRNFLLQRINLVDYQQNTEKKTPYSDCEIIKRIQKKYRFHRLKRYRNDVKHHKVRDFVYASTMGWTKSYSGEILNKYVSDLDVFLSSKSLTVTDVPLEYFKAHPAYEDFLDFYSLLYEDVHITGTRRRTHKYIKTIDSITSTPDLESFRDHRTASLINLVDMCFYHGGEDGAKKLREDYRYKLLRHLSVKILQIEGIMSKYRREYENGDDSHIKAIFAKYTHDGYFVSKLIRLIRQDDRHIQLDTDLFSKAILTVNHNTLSNFQKLYSDINNIPEYGLDLKSSDLRYVILKATESESNIGIVQGRNKNDNIEDRYDKSLTPKQRQYKMTVAYGIFMLPIIILLLYSAKDVGTDPKITAGIFTIIAAILTFYMNEVSKLRTARIEEESRKKLYYSEFEDLIRHLEANMKIMIQLIGDMEEGKISKPTAVHFDNLKWPSESCLFSDEMAKIIGKSKVDDFARLKVNLRNINNSAQWLYDYSHSSTYNKKSMIQKMDWELTRYFGYYINFVYLKENDFSFPSQAQIDTYIADRGIRHKMAQLFLADSPEDSDSKVKKYISQYYADRREHRSVLGN